MALAQAGVEGWSGENKPLWFWLSRRLAEFPAWLTFNTFIGSDQRRIGSINAMTALHAPIFEDDFIKISKLEELWFGASISASVKNAALEYIAEAGDAALISLAEREFEQNNYATRKSALEAVIRARSRQSIRDAATFALDASFDELSRVPTALILSGMLELDDAKLVDALEHRSGVVRAKAIELLAQRNQLTEVQMRRFFGNASIETRCAAVAAFEAAIRPLSHEEAERALVLKETKSGLLGSGNNFDRDGHAAFDERKRKVLIGCSISELQEGMRSDIWEVEYYYLAIAESYFKEHSEVLRINVDGRFIDYWRDYLGFVREKLGTNGDAVAEIINKSGEFYRRRLLRRSLDILLKKSDPQDLPRLRRVIDEDAADPRIHDIDFFQKWGEWEDIVRIAKIADDYRSLGGASTLLLSRTDPQAAILPILKLAGNRGADITALGISPRILAKVIAAMPMASFRKFGQVIIEDLLGRETDIIRKATALQILNILNLSEAKKYLNRYLNPENHRYYNVIFWLDLSDSWSRESYRNIARRELKRISN